MDHSDFQGKECTKRAISGSGRNPPTRARAKRARFRRPSDKSLRKVIEVFKRAAVEGELCLPFSEVVKRTGELSLDTVKLSTDTVNRCLKVLSEGGVVSSEKYGEWCIEKETLAKIEELESWASKIEELDPGTYETMLMSVPLIMLAVSEATKIAENVALRLDQYRDNPRLLASILKIMQYLPPGALMEYPKKIETIVSDNVRGGQDLQQPALSMMNGYYYDQVFIEGMDLLDKILTEHARAEAKTVAEAKTDVFWRIFSETLGTKRWIGDRDARAYVLSRIPNKNGAFKRLIDMSRQETDPTRRSEIGEILENFEQFTKRW